MFGRFAWLTTVTVAALCPALLRAQVYDPQMPAPYAMAGPGYYGQPDPGMMAMPGYGGDYTYGRTRYTQLPDDLGFAYGDTRLERFLKETFRHAFFRLEYLNWNISDPGNTILGGTLLNPDPSTAINQPVLDPSTPFGVFDPATGTLIGDGVSPVLNGVKLMNNNGIRGTWGFNFEPFSVEASVFALQTSRTTVTAGSLPVTPTFDLLGQPTLPYTGTFVVQGVSIDGVATPGTYLIYDQSYQASIRTGVWGADSKVVMKSIDTGGPFTIQPLFGVRFLNFNERLNQVGVYRDPLVTGSAATNTTRVINSATQNYLYGPQFGGRFELPSRYLTFGAEPTIMFGVNSYRATLATANIGSSLESPFYTRSVETTFGPVGELKVYGRGQLTDHLSLFVAYNLLWAGMITRPANNINYNVTGNTIPRPGAFSQDVHFSSLVLQGVSIGAEVSW